MIDYYYYQPEDSELPEDSRQHQEQQTKKKHPLLKMVVAGVLLILLLIVGIGLIGYWYVDNTPLSNEDGRTNLVILGVDDAAGLSDTIILVSIDQTDRNQPQIAMLGIPRDLYLPLAEFGSAKINAAHSYGEIYDYDGGGPGLMMDTLEQNFNLPIHYYATLDFDGFEQIIDTVGGVEVEVKTDIHDPFYPAEGYDGYEPFTISSGRHQMDGETALKYTRSRQTTSDFDRAFRQQQVVLATKDKILEGDMLWSPSTIFVLLDVFDNYVNTNLSRLEIIKLANMSRYTELDSVQQYVLDSSNLLVGTRNETGSALVPRTGNFQEIELFIDDIFDQTEVEEFTPQQF